jgi:hypothetical protein
MVVPGTVERATSLQVGVVLPVSSAVAFNFGACGPQRTSGE